MSEDLTRVLSARLRELGWEDPEPQALRQLSGGASRRTWSFDAGGRNLVLRHDPPNNPDPAGMAKEAGCLRAAARAAVPVPDLLDHGDGSGTLPWPYLLMERLDGETIPRRLLRDPALEDVRPKLPYQFGRILAAIHAVDARELTAVGELDAVTELTRIYHDLGEPRPSVEIGLRWLAGNHPPSHGISLVHGDFRTGNLMIDATGVRGVLDWELAHLGDPIEDLGWLCVKAWRFGSPHPVGGFGAREELLRGYADGGGTVPDAGTLHWWEVFGTLRWLVLCRMQAERARSGAERSVELTVLGRKVCEQEYDLLTAIGVTGEIPCATPIPADPGPHDWPSAAELLAAVRDFLVTDIRPDDDRLRFLTKVAANAVDIARRETELGPAQREAHAARLRNLGCATETDLALAIREGILADRHDEVTAAVFATVADKLAVANPNHLR